MHDERGLYYYPLVGNRKIRMYIRPAKDEVEFRLWDQDDETLWEEHGWVPYSAIQQAAELYEKEGRKGKVPLHLYDMDAAIRLMRDYVQEIERKERMGEI
jgi:hypothetical protein